MKKLLLCLVLFYLLDFSVYCQTTEPVKPASPHIFHNIGWNVLNSVTYNYGLNFVGAGLGTWGMIESGIDWKWRNLVFDNDLLSQISHPAMLTGYIVPIATPLTFLVFGKALEDEKLVVAASALTQTLILTMAIQSPLKMITGRRDPGLQNNNYYEKVYDADDFSGVFNWFNMDFHSGWPSGHTANAFSAAAAVTQIYDNIWIKVGAYTYATLIGLGTTVHAHWASEVIAGALIGYAIGKTVGISYQRFLDKNEETEPISFYFTPRSAGIVIRM